MKENNTDLQDGKHCLQGDVMPSPAEFGFGAKGAAVALVGFEESQAVTIALREQGIEAYSCDLQDCSGGHPEWHLKIDIFEALRQVGCHPIRQ